MLRIDDASFERLIEYIKTNFGIDLSGKKKLVESRLSIMLAERGFKDYKEYLARCFSGDKNGEIVMLVNSLTTNHTFFMREPEHFRFLSDTVLPYLVEKNSAKRCMRIWSAGCSSGAEAYTAAMCISEYLRGERHKWDTRILATDISVKILSEAQAGIYPRKSIQSLPDGWESRYFLPIGQDKIKICREIRENVIFRVFNLMDEIPFKKAPFDLIFCRNVMIYFDKSTRAALINRFCNALAPGGYLFVGHSEGMPRGITGLKYVAPAIYRKPLNS